MRHELFIYRFMVYPYAEPFANAHTHPRTHVSTRHTRPIPFNRSRRLRKNRTTLIGFLSLNIIIISYTYRVPRFISCAMPPVLRRVGLLLYNIKFAKSQDIIAVGMMAYRFFGSPTSNMLVREQMFLNGQIFIKRSSITVVLLSTVYLHPNCVDSGVYILGSFFNHY